MEIGLRYLSDFIDNKKRGRERKKNWESFMGFFAREYGKILFCFLEKGGGGGRRRNGSAMSEK